MENSEILEYAKKYLSQLKLGIDPTEIKAGLGKQQFDENQLKSIIEEADKLLIQEYSLKIKKHLLNEDLETHLDEFPLINDREFEILQRKEHQNLINFCNSKVDRFYKEKKTIGEIEILVCNPYYDREDVERQIAKSHLQFQRDNKEKSSFLLAIGFCLLVVGFGLVFLINTGNSNFDPYLTLLGIGGLIFALIVLYIA